MLSHKGGSLGNLSLWKPFKTLKYNFKGLLFKTFIPPLHIFFSSDFELAAEILGFFILKA